MSTATHNNTALTLDNGTLDPVPAFLTKPTNAVDIVTALSPAPLVVDQGQTFRTAATTRGTVDNSVSKQWANRPDDERYTDLYAMLDAVSKRWDNCRTVDLYANDVQVTDDMQLLFPEHGEIDFTNWTFRQICQLATVPQEYMKRLPSDLASKCLRHSIAAAGHDKIKALINVEKHELRALNAETYGRVPDKDLLKEIIKIAGNGRGDTIWKIPGEIDWNSSNGTTVTYNPYVDITKENTTLYASDRDCFVFLVDDTHPIEIGKLPNGEPDLLFRGFYAWNSETGACSMGISTMLMRGVCQNRNIWGVEGKTELRLKHSKTGMDKLAAQAFPMLAAYALSPTTGVIGKVQAARTTIIAKDADERQTFLMGKVGLNKTTSDLVQGKHLQEEGKPISSIWDAVQGITAAARTMTHQDLRVDLENRAGKLMERVTV